jgi:hypothetical protein
MTAEHIATKIIDAVKRYDDGVTFMTIIAEQIERGSYAI